METSQQSYKRTIAGSVGAGMGAIFNGSGRTYYILEHKTNSGYHRAGDSQKIIVDQIEMGRDGACQVRFDESCETVSRKHAAIVKEGDRYKLIPLSQTNGTYVNNQLVQGPYFLNSGDEIKLSSNGPVVGFIIPQGAKSLVSSIGLTERMNLFRQQALRPYKMALAVLAFILVLSVGGLVGWNIYQNKTHNDEITKLNEEFLQSKKLYDIESEKVIKAETDLKSAMNQLELLQRDANASKQQIQEANERAERAQNAAYAAQNAARKAQQEMNESQIRLQNIANPKSSEGSENSNSAMEVVQNNAIYDAPMDNIVPTIRIEDIYTNVYYIKMNNIEIYDTENRQVATFNTENIIGGTGFMLNDGRFVTARRVIEPWFYFQNTRLGSFGKVDWYMEDVQACIDNNYRVVANFTAYSSSGANFQFRNTDMRSSGLKYNSSTVEQRKTVITTVYNPVNPKQSAIYLLFKKKSYTVYWYTTSYSQDWASMMKTDQLNIVNGLDYSYEYSRSPKANTEVSIIGYPMAGGFRDSQRVRPRRDLNNINVSGLNDMNVIELSSRRWQNGNDGAPVVIENDGMWTVIGILSHTDTADRDVVTPIANTAN